ncbi:MAG: hypothetical protein FK734_05175 [Asgard group archaeon]|nr:hypothetical protein [Asgard group archaeon]
MFTKKTNVDDDDLVLMETKTLEEKCGNCGKKLTLKIYWSKEDYRQKIECEDCGIAVWKNPEKRESI